MAQLMTRPNGAERKTIVYGKGQSTCAEYLVEVKDIPIGSMGYINNGSRKYFNELSYYSQWAYGYISGHIKYSSTSCTRNIFSVDLTEELDAWLRHYCDKKPSMRLFQALDVYISDAEQQNNCLDNSDAQSSTLKPQPAISVPVPMESVK
jgi:hypothetical protein